MGLINPADFMTVQDQETGETGWAHGVTVVKLEARLVACFCDEPDCRSRELISKLSNGKSTTEAVLVQVEVADSAPPALVMAGWEAVEQALIQGKTAAASECVRDMVARGMGGQ